jgi:enamine deaminase RidA (YjgF/YER057c/UK114 family)
VSWDARIRELGLDLGEPLGTGGRYNSVVIDGAVAYTSGVVAVEGPPYHVALPGRVGDDLSAEDARLSARGAMISTLRNLRGALGGELDGVERFLKLTGYVRVAEDFTSLPGVLDGASELLEEIFGRDLLPARTTVGVYGLPGGASVELDTVVRLAR